jgi:1,4-dihydroxy-2-naphthoyl-CoA hydrolase
MLWRYKPELEALNQTRQNTAVGHLGIQFSAIGDDWLEAIMPVDERTKQPAGILHGGATALLAETVGSVASVLIVQWPQQQAVGIELNISHLRAVKSGYITARAMPVRIGRRTHVWDIRVRDEAEKPVAVARLTMAILSS